MRLLLIAAIPLLMTACTTDTAETAITGSDRTEEGCIPSAGYAWCERTQQCERPWELAQSQGIKDSQEGFVSFCDG